MLWFLETRKLEKIGTNDICFKIYKFHILEQIVINFMRNFVPTLPKKRQKSVIID